MKIITDNITKSTSYKLANGIIATHVFTDKKDWYKLLTVGNAQEIYKNGNLQYKEDISKLGKLYDANKSNEYHHDCLCSLVMCLDELGNVA